MLKTETLPTYLLTYSLTGVKSRDASASKNIDTIIMIRETAILPGMGDFNYERSPAAEERTTAKKT